MSDPNGQKTQGRAKRVARSISFLGLAEIVSRIFPLITLHHAERVLGMEAFGYANFGMSIFDLALPFVGFGYATYGAMSIAKTKGDSEATSRKVFAVIGAAFLQAALVFICLMGIVFLIPGYHQYRLIVFCLSFLLFTSTFDISFVNTATQRIASLSVMVIAAKTVGLFAILSLVQGPSDAIIYAALIFGTNALISFLTIWNNWGELRWSLPAAAEMKEAFFGALPFNLSGIILWVGDRLDLVLVESGLGLAAVGLYAGPYRVMQSISPILASLSRVFFSEMLGNESRESLTHLARFETFLLLGTLLPLAAGSWFAGGGLLAFILSDKYIDLGPLLSILFCSAIFLIWNTIFGYQIVWLKGGIKAVNWTVLSSIVIGLCFAIGLSHPYGLYGVAIGLGIGKLISSLVMSVIARKFIDQFPLREMISIVLATTCMSVALFFWRTNIWYLDVLIGAIVYAVSLLLFGRRTIIEIVGKLRAKRDEFASI